MYTFLSPNECVVPAPLPEDGAPAGVADAADHGGEGGGQGALAAAGGAAPRARAPLGPAPAPSVPLWTTRAATRVAAWTSVTKP